MQQTSLELILKEVEDPYVKENFDRIARYIADQTILAGQWKFYRIELSQSASLFKFKHNLKFVPKDIIVLSADGDKNIDFRFDLFDREYIYFSVHGPVVLRLLIGSYKDFAKNNLKDLDQVKYGDDGGIVVPAVPKLIEEFDTDVSTNVGDLVIVSSTDFVTKISTNDSLVIPNGIFGVGYKKLTPTRIQVLFSGIMEGYSGFSAGSPLFVQTTGVPGHARPATGTLQQIGFAIRSNAMFLQMLQPMRRA